MLTQTLDFTIIITIGVIKTVVMYRVSCINVSEPCSSSYKQVNSLLPQRSNQTFSIYVFMTNIFMCQLIWFDLTMFKFYAWIVKRG